jgi:hypothetical protein
MRFVAPLLLLMTVAAASAQTKLTYAPAPVDNPLKGMVPYVHGGGEGKFPHSLEFHYFALSDLMTGPKTFDFSVIEKYLALTQKHGCQIIFRVFMEYPGHKKSSVPQFLVDQGVQVTEWANPKNKRKNFTPDYENSKVRKALADFIAALGKKYDGDPRVGYITAGLLGSWGEWHNYPRSDLWASKTTQNVVLDAYEKAFKKTPILLRYPSPEDHQFQTANAKRPFGYHDDSFAWATLDTGKRKDGWFFMPLVTRAGAQSKWKTHPIGGELRPELWKKSFTDNLHSKDQGFVECVRKTHATWIMDSGLFGNKPLPKDRLKRAIEQTRTLGYEFHVASWQAKSTAKAVEIEIQVENRGVAPFYADWSAELSSEMKPAATILARFKLRSILPGESTTWRATIDHKHVGQTLYLSVPNPMKGGKPLRFANREQSGPWLTLEKRRD